MPFHDTTCLQPGDPGASEALVYLDNVLYVAALEAYAGVHGYIRAPVTTRDGEPFWVRGRVRILVPEYIT
jgi:hypothetical protein